jgi:alkylation response protein AidB-like acyl-CoA dehydrogenase
MDLELSAEQRELRDVARQALDARAPLALARAFLEGRPAAPLHSLLVELGWYTVGLAPDDGFGLPGLALLAEQVGAHAAPTALVDTAVAARIAALLDGAHAAAVSAGERSVALAALELTSDWSLRGTSTSLEHVGGTWRLNGAKIGVQHGETVDSLMVFADCDGRPALALVPADAAGIEVRASSSADPAAATATVKLDSVVVAPEAVLTGATTLEATRAAFAVGAVATAAEGIGAASAALDLAITYAREREQFGRPIGSFQALKHLMADAHVDREVAWSSVLYAAAALDELLPDAQDAAAIAAAYGARASRVVVEVALQVLGGIAFTWEHDVHLLQRRVLSCERRFGDALAHESRLGARLTARRAEVAA